MTIKLPKLRALETEFRSGYCASVFENFQIKIMIDGHIHPILIRVVPNALFYNMDCLSVKIF